MTSTDPDPDPAPSGVRSLTPKRSPPPWLGGCEAAQYRFRWAHGFPFHRFSSLRHHAPKAGQIDVCHAKHIIGCFSGATAALVGPLPTFVSTVQRHFWSFF